MKGKRKGLQPDGSLGRRRSPGGHRDRAGPASGGRGVAV